MKIELNTKCNFWKTSGISHLSSPAQYHPKWSVVAAALCFVGVFQWQRLPTDPGWGKAERRSVLGTTKPWLEHQLEPCLGLMYIGCMWDPDRVQVPAWGPLLCVTPPLSHPVSFISEAVPSIKPYKAQKIATWQSWRRSAEENGRKSPKPGAVITAKGSSTSTE